jgi:positive regulator of sigma E activity
VSGMRAIEERGVVIDGGGGTARVRIERTRECGECCACRFSEKEYFVIAGVRDRLGVRAGDVVRVRTEGAAPVIMLLLLFVFPVALLFAGYAAGSAIPSALGVPSASPASGIVVATLSFFGAFGVLYLFTRRKTGAASERSFIIEVLTTQGSPGR